MPESILCLFCLSLAMFLFLLLLYSFNFFSFSFLSLVAWRSGLDFLVFPLFFPVATLYIHGTDICMYEFFIFNLTISSFFLPVFYCENPDRSAFSRSAVLVSIRPQCDQTWL